jgi:hypothetical protein
VPVTRRIEIALRDSDAKLEVVDGAGLAFEQPARMKHAAAIFERTHERDFVALYEFHAILPAAAAVEWNGLHRQ